jgi:transposase-like protein
MITREEAVALRVTWQARAGILTCLHHYIFQERATSKRSTKNYLCMDCGADVVRRFTPSAENEPSLSPPR